MEGASFLLGPQIQINNASDGQYQNSQFDAMLSRSIDMILLLNLIDD